MNYADLELGIHRYNEAAYSVDFRFSLPDSDADIRFGQAQSVEITFDFTELRKSMFLPEAYGKLLSEMLFADPALRAAFAQARGAAAGADLALRLRLLIGVSAPELHNLYWETLLDPETQIPFACDENILFSRYLTSQDWRPVRLKPRGNLNGLVVVAAPEDLDAYDLAAIDVAAEIERARVGLGAIPFRQLPAQGSLATLENLLAALHQEPVPDLLYLICHGAMVHGQPFVLLTGPDGKCQHVPGIKLVQGLQQLRQYPRLIVLQSCESAGTDTGSALAALGPRLAEIGIPAVIAMQSALTMRTAAEFMPAFFEELQRDGQIDRAMTVARARVRERPDAWCLTLFMRLKSGRLWYTPGFSDDRKGTEKLPAQVRNIKRGRSTPILGPGLVEPLLGSLRDIAQRWADDFHYPMRPYERESLPQVAQFLAVNQDTRFPFDDLEDSLKQHIRETYPAELAAVGLPSKNTLNQLIGAVGTLARKTHELDPHKVLASLPLPIYITANQDYLLEDALREAGKDPQTVLCPWNEYIEQAQSVFDREPNYEPTAERPTIFHLFGVWDQPDSVVLTEDHYFDFLTGVTGNKKLIPDLIRQALADTGLLFLGFQTEDWSFRVIFRSLLMQPGSSRRNLYAHIAAQIEPEDGRNLEPVRAKRYLEQYFHKGADVDIYWGSPEEFMAELMKYWNKNRL